MQLHYTTHMHKSGGEGGKEGHAPTGSWRPIEQDTFPWLSCPTEQMRIAHRKYYCLLERLLGVSQSCHFLEAHSPAFQDGGLNSSVAPN